MCRGNDHGGRRCPHDTSDARQGRRVRAREGAKLRDSLSDPNATAGTQVLAEHCDDYREVINALGLSHFDEGTLRQAQQALSRRANLPEDLDHAIALTSAVSALYNYQAAKRRMGIISATMWHLPLTDSEVEAEKAMLLLGDRVEALAKHHGAPALAEWEPAIAAWQAQYGEHKLRIDQTFKQIETNRRAYKRLVNIGGNKDEAEALRLHNNELIDTYNRFVKDAEAASTVRGAGPLYVELVERRAKAYRAALTEVGVEFAAPFDVAYTIDKNRPKLERTIGEAATYYPKQWVRAARLRDGSNRTLRVNQRGSRPHYVYQTNELQVSTADKGDLVHELGHYLEHANPEVSEAERYFLNRRSGMLDAHRNNTRVPYRNIVNGTREAGFEDNFVHGYVGRIYEYSGRSANTPAGAYEILTVGMESIFMGRFGAGVGVGKNRADPEHTKFLLGLLASTADPEV